MLRELEKNREERNTNAAATIALTCGDPVLITSGIFVIDENDTAFFKRIYRNNNFQDNLLGNGWISSIDERLIFGYSNIQENKILELEKKKKEIEQHRSHAKFWANYFSKVRPYYLSIEKYASNFTELPFPHK